MSVETDRGPRLRETACPVGADVRGGEYGRESAATHVVPPQVPTAVSLAVLRRDDQLRSDELRVPGVAPSGPVRAGAGCRDSHLPLDARRE
jgi:hypothetical protein